MRAIIASAQGREGEVIATTVAAVRRLTSLRFHCAEPLAYSSWAFNFIIVYSSNADAASAAVFAAAPPALKLTTGAIVCGRGRVLFHFRGSRAFWGYVLAARSPLYRYRQNKWCTGNLGPFPHCLLPLL